VVEYLLILLSGCGDMFRFALIEDEVQSQPASRL
jgi:hypothetical protein